VTDDPDPRPAPDLLRPPLLDGRGDLVDPVEVVELDRISEPISVPGDRIRIGVATRQPSDAARSVASSLDLSVVPAAAADERWFAGVPDPAGAVASLCAAIAENPRAAVVLTHVLRADVRDVPTALDLESFAYSTLLGGAEFARWLARRGPRPLPPDVADPVLTARSGNRLSVTLNRPQRRNAYGAQMRDALVDALRLAVLDDTIERVVLDGAGPCFCSGGDLDEFGTTPDPVLAHLIRTTAGAGSLLHRLADRVEVRVHGPCVGAGIELPAFAGRVIAAPGATFRLPEIAMGLIPGAGGTVSLARRIGRWRTAFMALSGSPVSAETAVRWGLVDAVV